VRPDKRRHRRRAGRRETALRRPHEPCFRLAKQRASQRSKAPIPECTADLGPGRRTRMPRHQGSTSSREHARHRGQQRPPERSDQELVRSVRMPA